MLTRAVLAGGLRVQPQSGGDLVTTIVYWLRSSSASAKT